MSKWINVAILLSCMMLLWTFRPAVFMPPTPLSEGSVALADNRKNTYQISEGYKVVPVDPKGNRRVVLLTIDDGPKSPKMNRQMLDTMDKHKVKAIFFVNGYMTEMRPDVLKTIHRRGHEIGNHSWDHIDLSKQTRMRIVKQIYDVQKIVKANTGTAPRFFRPPYGAHNQQVKQLMGPNKLFMMNWSNTSDDWMSINRQPQKVIDNVMKNLSPGSIILIHELPWTTLALSELITQIRNKGYQFISPDQIVVP